MNQTNRISRRGFITAAAAASGAMLTKPTLAEPSTSRIAAAEGQQTAPPLYDPAWRERYFQGHPLRIGNRVQFLLDEYLVEDRFGVHRVIGPVEKDPANPLTDIGLNELPYEKTLRYTPVDPDNPPPSPSFDVVSSRGPSLSNVIYDPWEKIYKSYYVVSHYAPNIETGYNRSTFMLESDDGIRWSKPALDFFPINGKKTNCVMRNPKGGTAQINEIFVNHDAADPQRRFSATFKTTPPGERSRCLVLMHSADGREWKMDPDNPILFRGASDGSYSFVHDADRNRWLLYRRPPTRALMGSLQPGVYGLRPYDGARYLNNKRRVAVSTSENFINWTHPRTIHLPDESDQANLGMLGNNMDIDAVSVVKYGDLFFGFLGMMNNLGHAPRHTQLMWSRDGLNWQRLPDRPRFIENGEPGEWDHGQVGVMSFVPNNDRITIYYLGSTRPQKDKRLPQQHASGLAYLGRDRFIGQHGGIEGGFLLTRQFVLEGNRLVLNCHCPVQRPPQDWNGGLIRAEILQAPEEHLSAKPHPGFAMADCDPIEVKNDYDRVVTWKGSPDLSALRGKAVYVRFFLQNATLYTMQVRDEA